MRIDDFLSSVGLIKRRTIAKQLGQNGLLAVNGRTVKPAYQINTGDIVQVKGTNPLAVEVTSIPAGSVPKEKRDNYFKKVSSVS